jgi:recombinational DNA repair ATPase RecF
MSDEDFNASDVTAQIVLQFDDLLTQRATLLASARLPDADIDQINAALADLDAQVVALRARA